jgi:hypothetical protein
MLQTRVAQLQQVTVLAQVQHAMQLQMQIVDVQVAVDGQKDSWKLKRKAGVSNVR